MNLRFDHALLLPYVFSLYVFFRHITPRLIPSGALPLIGFSRALLRLLKTLPIGVLSSVRCALLFARAIRVLRSDAMLDGGIFRIASRIDDEECKTSGNDQNAEDRRLHGRKYDFMFFALNPTRGGLCSSRRSRNGFPPARASILCHSAYSITYRRFWKRSKKNIRKKKYHLKKSTAELHNTLPNPPNRSCRRFLIRGRISFSPNTPDILSISYKSNRFPEVRSVVSERR